MRSAFVLLHDKYVGTLSETEDGYSFAYLPEYIGTNNPAPVSLTLPVRNEPYFSNVLMPFFDGLIPEGWLLDIAQRNWKINPRDRMGLLLATCKDCIGAVSIEPAP